MEYKKKTECNFSDIKLAISQAVVPMQNNIDYEHNIPYFINVLEKGVFKNSHHTSYSAAHVPGRWLNALFAAKETIGADIDEKVVDVLRESTYYVFKHSIGLPQCLNIETLKPINLCDLHNLREYMYALYVLIKHRCDKTAYEIAMRVIETVDTYFDYENNFWDAKRFEREKGCRTYTAPVKQGDELDYYFPSSFGRFIGPLVKLYRDCGVKEALVQAIKLKDCAVQHVLADDGAYIPRIMGGHTHSVTSMMSSLALLSEMTGDHELRKKIYAFADNGLSDIALDFGWCLENYYRQDWGGEANNTSDIIRTLLTLAQFRDASLYSRAERILRAHLLPSQLLDGDVAGNNSSSGQDKPVMKGAFGFPTPLGHEREGSGIICYNWDIVGGAVDGLCEAYSKIVSYRKQTVDINMLFSFEDGQLRITDPYENGDTLEVSRLVPDSRILRINVSDAMEVAGVEGIDASGWYVSGGGLFIIGDFKHIEIKLAMEDKLCDYCFRGKCIRYLWHGNMVKKASPSEARLRFFDDLN